MASSSSSSSSSSSVRNLQFDSVSPAGGQAPPMR